ncbi:transposase, IS605 family [Synechococcus sp. PCC 7335]|uniref:RNA-guided endonuclease InsQ/TnpB family protein n=1 Tax=Synechococcus sp. (strain ATCC 29403 / PCC 7335) TaxID=91464 RepID=UPI00017ECF29|nr:RNA-guided endonuclease TnpB family protein [Synechococcus sp. PCC 7335]EDX82637.1 transposase, IS605 family [Synechococcus sp. PCC 7335]
MLTRRTTFRLYPTPAQSAQLFEWRRLHAYLYNAAMANRRVQYKQFSHSVDYFEQQNSLPAFKEVWPEYKALGSHALQATLKRVDFAFQRFFKGLGGYPKFKSIRRYSGWTYPCKQSWKALSDGKHGRLKLTNLGEIRMRGQARTWGTPTTCTILYRAGKWFASITVQCEPQRATGPGAVGIDLGCKDTVSFSDGSKERKPAFIAVGERAVVAASKAKRRKRAPNRKQGITASNRWKKAAKRVAKLQRHVTRQRTDWMHKLTSDIVSRNSLIAGEQLSVKNMTRKAKKGSKRKRQKAGLNRSILSVGFASISSMLAYKSAESGGIYTESPTRKLKPTQRCAKCWELTPKTLKDRVHVCSNPECQHVEDRDTNAAQVNLIWARGAECASSNAESASSTSCGSLKQLAAVKRQKLLNAGTETPFSREAG